MFVFGSFTAVVAIGSAAAGDATATLAWFVTGAFSVLFFWVTCAFWLSLKVAGALVRCCTRPTVSSISSQMSGI
eukprot:COSAG06_NODE_859_length_11882_cov_31.614701_6_plen_74_part_00